MRKFIFACVLLCSFHSFAQPANDLCAGALPINPNNGCVTGTTVGADDSWVGAVGCQGGGTNVDVWYTFTAINGQLNYDVTTSGAWAGDVEFILVEATGACTGLGIAGSDCGPSVLSGTINGLQAGTLYYITISTPSGGTPGDFTLCIDNVAPPIIPGQDCSTAAILCDDATFSQSTSSAGFGTQEITTANSCWGSGGERQSKWFKFTIGCDGTLEFNINPAVSSNDYDWALFDVTSGTCPSTASATPSSIACNWSGCKGSTGISTCVDIATDEPGTVTSGAGCQGGPAAWETTVINATAGQTYALLVDNFSASNSGFTLTFGGACGGGTALIGPDAAFTYTNPSCGVYNFTKTCQTTNSTFLWTFGDGTTSTLQNPTHTYTSTGTFTAVLEVTDALGCTRTSSETFTVNFPVASATPNPDAICSGETTSIVLSSTVPGTTYSWIATDNANVTGESLTAQTATTISNTLVNTSPTPQVVTYTVTPTAAGCVGADLIVQVTVNPIPVISGNAPICVGETLQLSASGTPNATTPWTSSNTGVATVDNTGLVTSVSAGSTTITYTDDVGCQQTAVVTVNAVPTITGNAPICIGATLQLTGSGTPDGSTPWTSSVPGVATVSNTGLVTGVGAGTTTITYLEASGCQNTVTVTVNAGATISGNAPICEGETLQLTGSGTPDATTPWTSSNTGVATIDNTGVVTSVSAGSTTITYLDANGCQATVVVTVNPTPTISGNAPVCVGATVQLTGSGTPNGTTPWTSSNTGVATVNTTGLVTGVAAGTSTITYTNSAGCQATVVVTVNDLPVISTTQTPLSGCNSGDGVIQVSDAGGATGTVNWTGTASGTSGVVTLPYNITSLAAGTYDVTFTSSATGCTSTISQEVLINPGAPVVDPIADTISCGVSFTLLNADISGTLTGNQAYYTATGGPSGAGSLIPDGTVFSAPTNTVIYAYDESGACSSEVFFNVIVNPIPTISGNAPICVGSTVQLTGSGTPDATTPWTSSNTGVATVDNTGLVTGVAAGTATITYMDNNGCQNTVSVTVNDNPTISGNAPICQGETLQLTGSGTPDATTPWTSSNTGVATVDNAGLVTSVSAGSTTITYLDANGCQATVVVTVNPTPTISGNTPVCVGETLQLTGSGTPAAVTPWSSSNTSVATIGSTGLLTAAAAGTTTITYTNDAGCQNTVLVTVNAAPVISTSQTPLSGCNAGDGVIQVSDAGGATGTVNWTGTASGTSGVVTLPYNITGLNAGTYNVTFTSSATGCTSSTSQEVLANPGAPIIDPIADTVSCGVSFTLLNSAMTGTLTGNQAYYTATGGPSGAGTLIPDGTVFSAPTNTVIYAYDESGSCASEVFFNVVVNPIPTISGNTPICVGSTVQLTGTGTPDGTTPWSTSDAGVATVNTSGLVTGISAGTATITYMDNNGCQNTVDVTVNANPTISGNAPICDGETLQLTGSGTPDGTTPWTSSNTGVATVDNTGLVTSVSAGSTTITYLDANGCQETVVVTVNPTPTISGNTPICIGSTVQLTGSGTPDATTPWASSNTGIATVNTTGLVTAVSAGTSTITFMNSSGCQATVVVTVNADPIISTTQTPLSGCNSGDGVIQVSDAGGATGTVNWTGTASGTSGVVTLPYDITGLSAGTYDVTFTSSATGCTSSASQEVLTNPNAPVVDPISDTISCGVSFTLLNADISGSLTGNQAYFTASGGPSGTGTLIPDGTVYSAPTNTVIYAYDESGTCSSEVFFTVTVNSIPTISGNTSVCVGSTEQLTGTGTPDGTTPWSTSDAGVATVSTTGLVTGVSAGTVTITYMDNNGCQNTTTVTVNDLPTISGNAPICGTGTVQLTGSGTPNATTPWTSSNAGVATVDNSGLVTGVSAGTTTITYTNDNGCQVTETVTVNPTPTISGNAPICIGDNVQLTGSGIPDGTTPWTSSNTSVATVSNTGLVSGVTAGTSTITYTDNNGCQNTVTVTVNALPTISGVTTLCSGSTSALTGSGTPNATNPWTSSNATVATIDASGVVTAVSAGTTTITYTNDAGCSTTATVTVNNVPTLSGASDICGTSTITLTGSGTPNGTTPWTSSNTGVATVDNSGNVTGVAAGTTTITYMDDNGCEATQVVNVYDNPTISGVAPVCAGTTLQLTGSGTPNATTPWTSSNPGVASVDASGLITAAAAGTVTITYMDVNGCQTTESITVLASPIINPVTDQTACDVFLLPAISGTDLTANVSYWTGAGGTGTQLSQGDPITTTSTIYIYDQNGSCTSEVSFVVTVNPAPVLDIVADTAVCASFDLPTIQGQNLTGNEAYYNDSQANGGTVITGPLTTSQTIWIYDGSGSCSDEVSFNLTVNPLPTASISGGGVYCEGDAIADVVVDVTGSPDWTINYTLNGTPQVATGSSSPISLGNAEGDYVLIDVSDASCSSSATGTETISITPTPSAPSVSGGAEYCSTETLNDLMASGGNGTFTWYSDATLSSVIGNGDALTPSSTTGTTTYYVTETVNGCEGPSSDISITISECAISVPTAFTPNGDNAHDTWELINLDEAYPNNIVRVFNRWGNILFESAPGNYNANVWDGSYKGETLPVGSYYFIIELNNDEQETITGTVTIVLE